MHMVYSICLLFAPQVARVFSRILYFTTLASTFFLYEIYAASLTSVFTVDVFEPPVKSLQDILDLGYQVNVWKGTAHEEYFKVNQGYYFL